MLNGATIKPRARRNCSSREEVGRKKRKISTSVQDSRFEFFEELPKDLVVEIISKLGATASRPSDFVHLRLTSKKFNELGRNPLVLSRVSPKVFTPSARNWGEGAFRFLKLCIVAGNVEAIYTLGMIWFYCEGKRDYGTTLLKKAAMESHAEALYSLSVIHFNGSGLAKDGKDLQAGIVLAARAAFLGHVNALRELGHCLLDGYGVRKNLAEGRRFLMQANARKIAFLMPPATAHNTVGSIPVPVPKTVPPKAFSTFQWITSLPNLNLSVSGSDSGSPLMSDFRYNVTRQELHPVNCFLTEWFGLLDRVPSSGDDHELTLCSNEGCGRPETRKHEFRRCSICQVVGYCSRACQALDWKRRHWGKCVPMVDNHVDGEGEDGEESDEDDNALDEIQAEVVVDAHLE